MRSISDVWNSEGVTAFHTSNTCRAGTFPYTKLNAPPEGRSDDGRCNDSTHNVTTCFQARKRYFAFPAPFSSISFPARGAGTKLQPSAAVAIWRGRAAKCMSSAACGGTKNMELARTSPRSGGCGFANRTAPPAQRKKLTHHNTLSSYAGTA